MARKPPPSEFDVHPSIAMFQEWIATLKPKTGRTLDQWVKHITKDGPPDTKARRAWLKDTYSLGTNTAWWLVERAEGTDDWWEGDPENYLRTAGNYVEEMYAKKPVLKPLHDKLLALGRSLGSDVKVCPCKTIVPLYREHVFAQIKPSIKTRLDFGLALGDTKATGRLIDTGGFAKKDRITHRFALASVDEIDAEVIEWLQVAYERDGK